MSKHLLPSVETQTMPPRAMATIEPREITKRKIGGTTYIVTSKYKGNSKEGLLDKLWWLIQNDE